MNSSITTIFFIFFTFLTGLSGQNQNYFEKVKLGKNNDYSIFFSLAQDDYNILWGGTDEGLLRFDSHKSKLYNEYDGLPESFNTKISKVKIDDEGNMWICSDNRLAARFKDQTEFTDITPPKDFSLSLIYDIGIMDDKIYLATFNGLVIISKRENQENWHFEVINRNTSFFHISEYKNTLILGTNKGSYMLQDNILSSLSEFSHEQITSLTERKDSIIVGTVEGNIYLIDKNFTQKSLLYKFDTPITDIISIPDQEEVFVSTDGLGIFELNENLRITQTFSYDPNDNNSLKVNGVYDLMYSDHFLWAATYGGGIYKLNTLGNPFNKIVHNPNNYQSIGNNFVKTIIETEEGERWYGTKTGISIYDPSKKSWRHILNQGMGEDFPAPVLTLMEDNDFVWAGTFGNGAFKINKKTLKIENFSSDRSGNHQLPIDKIYTIEKTNDTIWFGGIGAPIHYLTGHNVIGNIPIGQIRLIKKNNDGRLYALGRQGVFVIKNDTAYPIKELSTNNQSLNYFTLNCMAMINDHEFWIGTHGDGLLKYNTKSGKVTTIDMSNGLPSDIVQSIVQDGQNLWLGTTKGLVYIENLKEGCHIKVYDKDDGLPSATFNLGSATKFNNGNFAFGSTEGAVHFSSQSVNRFKIIPNVVFESLEILNYDKKDKKNKVDLLPKENEPLKLDCHQNSIKIKYTGIDYYTPGKVLYQWKMGGISDTWSKPNPESEINFANLPADDYIFFVKSMNRDGEESKPISLSFVITPPWWASTYAFIVYGILLGLGILAMIKIFKELLLKKQAEAQIAFYNNITHELKTPLSILLTKLNPKMDKEFNAKEVKLTVERLSVLFDQLLNYGKINSSFYQDQKVQKINLKSYIESVIHNFENELHKKSIQMVTEYHWTEEVFYYNKDKLDKILFNIISNAIKYTGFQGNILLRIKKVKKGQLQIIIKDDGIGIPKDQQKNIMKRYFRARNAINSQMPGTGLGLLIVKNLVENDGGKITFFSEEGKGTEFSITINSQKNKYINSQQKDQKKASKALMTNKPKNGTSVKILVVEDNDELRIDLVEKLSEYYSIMAARNGAEGYEKAITKVPDLIITDLIMPEMDGIELCEKLKNNEETKHIPVFMMTVLNSPDQRLKSIQSGISFFMDKPVDFPILIAKINSILDYKKKLREKYLQEANIEKAGSFKDEREKEFINSLEQFILSKMHQDSLSVQDLCRHAGMSRTALYMKLKDVINQSPQNFIIKTKMNHAKKLLLEGGHTIKEIAYSVGFSNPKYFSTSFKKHFGQTPSEFLKSLNP